MRTQVAIVGGGPGGTSSALYLKERGIDSIIIEQDTFPRFHVGESLTGWAAERVREFGLGEEMDRLGFRVKYAGTVYAPAPGARFDVTVSARINDHERREVPTWQVRRSLFDKLLLDTAIARGAGHLHGRATEPLLTDSGAVGGVLVDTEDGQVRVEADVVIDASGRKTWLSTVGVAGKRMRGGYENQIAVFSHVKGAARNPDKEEGNTLLFYHSPDHWAWFIPIDPETVSIGVVTPTAYFKSRNETKDDFFLRELRELNPNLTHRVENIVHEEIHAASNFSYNIDKFAGPGWLCVGDAHRFIDPFFSFGIHLAMAEAQKAAEHIETYLSGETADLSNPFADYQETCQRGMDVVQDLMDSFWANPLGWGYLFHHTEHQGEILDIFGGRIYEEEPLDGLVAMQKISAKSAARSRHAGVDVIG